MMYTGIPQYYGRLNPYLHSSYQNRQARPFDQNSRKYRHCCLHVRHICGLLAFSTFCLCLCCLAFGILGILYQPAVKQLILEQTKLKSLYATYDAEEKLAFHYIYYGGAVILMAGSGLHTLTLLALLAGLCRVQPGCLLGELIVVGLLIGLLSFITIALVIFMVIMLGFLWLYTLLDVLSLVYNCYYIVIVWKCYGYLRDKRHALESERSAYSQYKSSEKYHGPLVRNFVKDRDGYL